LCAQRAFRPLKARIEQRAASPLGTQAASLCSVQRTLFPRSSVAPLTTHRRLNVPPFLQSSSDLFLRQFLFLRPIVRRVFRLAVLRHELSRFFPIRFPIEIRDLRFWAEEILRIPMAFEAPLHAVG